MGNEYLSYNVLVDYLTGNRVQLRIDNGGVERVEVLENKNGELRRLFSKIECYYRENFTPVINNKPEILLKEPLIKGNTWILADKRKRYIKPLRSLNVPNIFPASEK